MGGELRRLPRFRLAPFLRFAWPLFLTVVVMAMARLIRLNLPH